MIVILSHRSTSRTGRQLAKLLGLTSRRVPKRGDLVGVRWGSSVPYTPDISPNTPEAIRLSANGMKSLMFLRDNGVNVPTVYTTPPDEGYPILGRSINHRAGLDIVWCDSEEEARKTGSRYFTKYVSVTSEFRVHVFNDKVLRMFRKVGGNNGVIRTSEYGWDYRRSATGNHPGACKVAIASVGALGLTFGGVDMGWDGNKYVVFEVNTGPSLNTVSLMYYARELEKYLLSQEVGYVPVGLHWSDKIEEAVARSNQR